MVEENGKKKIGIRKVEEEYQKKKNGRRRSEEEEWKRKIGRRRMEEVEWKKKIESRRMEEEDRKQKNGRRRLEEEDRKKKNGRRSIESKPEMDPQELKWMIGIMASVTVVKFIFMIYCRRFKNEIVRAYAQDHFFDVITNSVGLVVVVLAVKYSWWIDPMGAIIIALYTISIWAKTVIENVWSLIGRTAPPDFLAKLTYLLWNHHEEVKHIDTVRAYTFGAHYFVEVDIVLPEDMPLNQAHNIGETLQEKLEQLPQVERAFVHIDFEFTHRPEHKMMSVASSDTFVDETKFSDNNFDEEESQPPEEEALEESIERLECGAFVGHIGNSIMKERCAQVNVGKTIMKEAISGQCATKLGSPGSPSTKVVQDVLTNLLVAVEAVKSISKPIMGLAQSLSNPTQTSNARSGTREKGMGAEKNELGSREDADCQTKIRDSKDAKGESSPCMEKPSEPRRCSGQSPVDFAQLCEGRNGTCDEDEGAEEIECRSREVDERQSKVCELKGEKGKVSLCLQTSLELRRCSTVGYGDKGVLNAMEPTLFEVPQTELIHHGDLGREGGQQSPDPLMLSCFPSAQVAECGDNFTTPTLGWKQRGLLEIGEPSRQPRWRSLSSIINLQIGSTSHTSHTGLVSNSVSSSASDGGIVNCNRRFWNSIDISEPVKIWEIGK
ncbi:hypothetical protein VNO80_25862 [Phaseolus coccineus]|uniref:Ig-like domain-containing protein n=1 Tax=Phaseolus coccineus TaxID=3886 RepID=A0AAN9QP36_PHACN